MKPRKSMEAVGDDGNGRAAVLRAESGTPGETSEDTPKGARNHTQVQLLCKCDGLSVIHVGSIATLGPEQEVYFLPVRQAGGRRSPEWLSVVYSFVPRDHGN